MVVNAALEYTAHKQPKSLDLYVEKMKGMNMRTLIKYNDRWEMLIVSKDVKTKDGDLPTRLEELVTNVINRAKTHQIRCSTFRQYKAAICYGLASILVMLNNDKIDENELEAGLSYQLLNNLYKEILTVQIDYSINNTLPERTSSLKKKSFPEAFYYYLVEMDVDKKKNVDSRFNLLVDFVKANIIVGLRPIEWLDVRICSEVETQNLILLVENAKNSQGRANGDLRELKLVGATEEDKYNILKFYIRFHNKLTTVVSTFLEQHKHFLAENSISDTHDSNALQYVLDEYEQTALDIPKSEICDDYGIPQNGIAERILNSIQNKLFIIYNQYLEGQESIDTKRVTLYSTRHQCIANAKSSKLNIFEIAAFFGHSSTETSSRHYGKAWSGWSSFSFKPSLESISNVNGSKPYLEKEYGYVQSKNEQVIEVKNDSKPDNDFGFRLI